MLWCHTWRLEAEEGPKGFSAREALAQYELWMFSRESNVQKMSSAYSWAPTTQTQGAVMGTEMKNKMAAAVLRKPSTDGQGHLDTNYSEICSGWVEMSKSSPEQ